MYRRPRDSYFDANGGSVWDVAVDLRVHRNSFWTIEDGFEDSLGAPPT
jgi:hypothetical protein